MELSRLRQNIFLIGDVDVQIVGNKLPTKLQALKVLFYHTRILNATVRDSIAAVIAEIIVFWKKAQIPTQDVQRCRDKLKKLYDEWRILAKHKNRNELAIKKQNEFVCSLKNIFDIAPSNVFELVDDNSKEFLTNQRLNGRIGYISNIKTKYDDNNEDVNKSDKKIRFAKRKKTK
ncbi:hypothetical protein PV328_010423 [Microctonus aethiopoides]|uniref:Uncharacterized protein n=1 Tax=Microctonus aethiopoides TaxID=144406 RepID=A0AA39KQA6_9HYME|nr:hypothetical protein PV328_010423 [Microctonus aethiopoides]